METKSREEELEICNIKSSFCIVLVAILKRNLQIMIDYCKEHKIGIPNKELHDWKVLLNAAKTLENYKFAASAKEINLFNQGVLVSDVFMRLLVSKIDKLDEFKVWQFYNYVKSFPATTNGLSPTVEEEAKAFPSIYTNIQ